MMDLSRKLILIKIGGAAITNKSEFETLQLESITRIGTLLKKLIDANMYDLILVHGAGSFGHFQAKKYQINNGKGFPNLPDPVLEQNYRMGLASTRQSVSKLNNVILDSFIQFGIPVITVSTNCQSSTESMLDQVDVALRSGYIPVVHGDAVLTDVTGRGTILSGDTITIDLVEKYQLRVSHVIFFTGISSVYGVQKPSSIPTYLSTIHIDEDGGLHDTDIVPLPSAQGMEKSVDTTGGIVGKLAVAGKIVSRYHKPVFILGISKEETDSVYLDVLINQIPKIGTCLLPINQ
ncbi:hypothetical protein HDV02_006148 [Globomyces sp. JEL0801]|nr:hypothetical protein HDV02_006148 [Globomyces sp. JEL0801]